jgi:excisionase family DNA binding protein
MTAEQEEWPSLLTVAEVASVLRCSKMTVYRLCSESNELGAVKIGRSYRIPELRLREYIQASADF